MAPSSTAAKSSRPPGASFNAAAWIFSIATCIKLLLIPSYRSTDFEVHRHWLALTSSLPLRQWYLDASSIWTLDYPPLFAHFSYLLSLPASLFDPAITSLSSSTGSHTPGTVLYLRLTAALCDLSLFFASYRLISTSRRRSLFTLVLILWSPSLFIVDHVHFQYNGFLLGIFLLSLGFLEEGKDLAGGFVFAVLLCSKHLFLVAAPLYFVYLLRHYCKGGFFRGFSRLVIMGIAVAAVFVASFGPFVYYGQIKQVFSRLFPFGRGLCHAYWAPNIWVFYILLDKALAFAFTKLGFIVETPMASFTGGLVGESSPFSLLPQVTPIVTFILVLLSMSPCLVKAFKNPQPRHVVRWVAYTCTCGFMFGWHVHEKASLHFTIPLALVATNSLDDAKHFFLLSIVSCYSLFPLLYEPQEYLTRLLLLLTYSFVMWVGLSSHFAPARKNGLVGWVSSIYLVGLASVELYGQFVHPYLFEKKLPFLPLMLVSFYCAIGMLYSWIWQLIYIMLHT
ncbi:hypothetical protein LUZ62_051118 [Rhynchospora pubera]|uniref:Alpha-1,3-glucosyltransferase n=1 Tax=Rhynchospora pubera TaxID=906938 RepID=A0AAV8G9A7_9POAL|nr:hypothetical protein LUZ62_051118 [Rhynchospora pubera]